MSAWAATAAIITIVILNLVAAAGTGGHHEQFCLFVCQRKQSSDGIEKDLGGGDRGGGGRRGGREGLPQVNPHINYPPPGLSLTK